LIGIKKIDRRPLAFTERLYLFNVVKGMAITLRHFLKNIFGTPNIATIAYPEVQEPAPAALRGRHRLMQRPDGTPKCVACMCCPTICPADCIHIVAEEAPDDTIEKRPVQFSIDYMRCVFCGLCVEACPVDAIRMDTGELVLADFTRESFIFDIKRLLSDEQGAEAPAHRLAQTGGFLPPAPGDGPVPPTGPYFPSEFLDRRTVVNRSSDARGTRVATAGEPRLETPTATDAPQ
jgi:NADH-quinone oxidoreductase subunit I